MQKEHTFSWQSPQRAWLIKPFAIFYNIKDTIFTLNVNTFSPSMQGCLKRIVMLNLFQHLVFI
ncbi:MAG: hypothetical protein J5798_05005, partial [Spirochaetaceae bacterium]|nr:hypothetical protein [Spirochaetaceae bacterium]